MSARLFRYTDLVRIHRAVTPDRAPGPAAVEVVQILYLISDLMSDGVDAFQAATRMGGFTAPRDLVVDFVQRWVKFIRDLGYDVFEIVVTSLEEGQGGTGGQE